MKLQERRALITGSGRGIGEQIALRLAQEGARVALLARDRQQLRSTGEKIEKIGAEYLIVPADLSSEGQIREAIGRVVDRWGGIDILVNNAGSSLSKGLEELNDDLWYQDLDLKLMAAVRMSRGVIPYMKKQGGGSILNAATGAGKVPESSRLPTSVSRAAGLNLTKSMANEFAKDKIRVNAICIGKIKSAQWERRSKGGDLQKLYSDLGKTIPLGRVGEAEEYADLAAFICSARASYITGAAINLDGGQCPSI